MDQPEYFLVTSYGRTATVWLTQALNLHPDILCSHGPSYIPIITRKNVPYTEASVVDAQNSSPQFHSQTIRQILLRLEEHGNARWIGNVHGFTSRNLWLRGWTELDTPPYRSVNLLRHPIARADSFWRRWQCERNFDSPFTRWIASEVTKKLKYQRTIKELKYYYNITLESFEERAFFYAVMQMSNDYRDMKLKTAQIISERLVSDMDYFAYTAKLLMGDSISLSNEYLDQVQQLGKQNASTTSGRDADSIFKSWQPWQRTLFMVFLRDHPKLAACYESYGYTLPQQASCPVAIDKKSTLAHLSESLIQNDMVSVLWHVGRTIGKNWKLRL